MSWRRWTCTPSSASRYKHGQHGRGKGVHGAWSLLTCHSWISQFSFGNSSHVECPHQTFGEPISDPGWDPFPPFHPHATAAKPNSIPALTSLLTAARLLSPPTNHHLLHDALSYPLAAPSWNVSMDTQAQQLVLHFSSRMPATFSAAWSHSGLGQDSMVPPVYNVSQVWPSQGLAPTRTC